MIVDARVVMKVWGFRRVAGSLYFLVNNSDGVTRRASDAGNGINSFLHYLGGDLVAT